MSSINLDSFLDIAAEAPPQEAHVNVRETKNTKGKKIITTHREFELKDWLASLSLSEYYQILFNEGFDKPLSLKLLTDEDLIEIGIKKKGHRLIVLNAVKDHYFASLSPNPGLYYSHGQNSPVYILQNNMQPPSSVSSSTSSSSSPSSLSRISTSRSHQLVPLGYVHRDSSDSEMEDITDSNYEHPSSTSSSLSHEQYSPHSPNSTPRQPSLSTHTHSPDSRHEYNEDEDPRPPLSSSQPLTQSQSHAHSHTTTKMKPISKSDSKLNVTASSPLSSSSNVFSSPQISPTIQPSQPPSTPDGQKATRKRVRAEKPDQSQNNQEKDDTPSKQRPSAITFIPNQHYSRSDVHDCLGGQRFCAISTPSAYPFILIFAHYQAYVGDDGLWEHCASGDVNKGVNRSVIHAKDRKKRLLLFFSISGQQGAVLFVGEVKYVSCEQKEEKNNKGVDKASVFFKFQKINNDSININLVDFRAIDPLASQPKPVIRSLTDNFIDNNSSDNPTTSTTNNNNNENNNNTNTNSDATNDNNSTLSDNIRPLLVNITASSDSVPINPTSPSLSPRSASFNSPSTSSSSPFFLLPIKQERLKDETEKNHNSTNNIPQLANDNSTFHNILNSENETEENIGWANFPSPSNKNKNTTTITNSSSSPSSSSSSSPFSPISISNLTSNNTHDDEIDSKLIYNNSFHNVNIKNLLVDESTGAQTNDDMFKFVGNN